MADNGNKPASNDDWLSALRELEELDRRREARKSITPRPVANTEESDSERGPKTPAPETPAPKTPAPEPPDLAQLEAEGAAKAPREETPTSEDQTPKPGSGGREAMRRYDELRKQKSVKVKSEDIAVMEEMSDVICTVNTASALLEKFRDRYGDLVPEQKLDTWKSNLRDTSMIMLKEFYALRNGKAAKVYDKRNICVRCNGVFMAPLPPDRICDECRGSMTPRAVKEE